jgi:hypothetical protein
MAEKTAFSALFSMKTQKPNTGAHHLNKDGVHTQWEIASDFYDSASKSGQTMLKFEGFCTNSLISRRTL